MVASVCLMWFLVSLISVNYLYRFSDKFVFSTNFMGLLGWVTIFSTLVILSKRFWRQVLFVFLFFFCFGLWRGPFLEPPSDPFEHLRRIQNHAQGYSDFIHRENRGLWHYSMAGNLIGESSENMDPERILLIIDVTHGLFLGLLLSGLFVLGKSAGLKNRWAYMSCLIAFLFMGTNSFSYFTYYSLAPSYTSLLILWLWTAAFFFRQDRCALILGTFLSLISLPVLWVNHRQEAVLLGFIYIVWMLLNFYFNSRNILSRENLSGEHKQSRLFEGLFWSILLFVSIILPQFDSFQNFLSDFFVRDYWLENQKLVFSWNGFHLWGKIWSYRVNDTLGNIAVIMLILALPYFWPRFIRNPVEKKVRVYILAILPFLVYCIPLFNFIWVSNVRYAEYYRFCYISMFWLLFAGFLQGIEGRIYIGCDNIREWVRRNAKPA